MDFKTFFTILFLLVFAANSSLHAAKSFGIQMAGVYTSQIIFRGAVLWPKPAFFPGPAFVFAEKVTVAGPSIFFSPSNREDSFQWKIGAQFMDDNEPPLSLESHEEDYRNKRKSTIESSLEASYNFGPRKGFAVGALVSKEWKEDYGLHSEVFAKVPFVPFTSLRARVSFSEKAMSQHIHGHGGVSGVGFASLGINGVIPFVPWDGVILARFTRFWVMQETNRAAHFIRGDSKNNVLGVTVIWNAL